MRKFISLALFTLGLGLATTTWAEEHAPVVVGTLEISGGFARATLPNAPVGGAYLTIVNNGTEADRLVGASTPLAGMTMLHEMSMQGGMMRMQNLPEGIEIPAGARVELSPGGLHIMFSALAAPLREGGMLPIPSRSARAGEVALDLPIGAINAKAAPGAAEMDHGAH